MGFRDVLLCCALATSAACHPGPILDTGAAPPSAGGTIAGIVTTADPAVAVPGRKVSAVNVTTGFRYDAVTALNGGYTIKVPEGRYRLELELHGGEMLSKQPADTSVSNSDLDTGRDFVVTARSGRS